MNFERLKKAGKGISKNSKAIKRYRTNLMEFEDFNLTFILKWFSMPRWSALEVSWCALGGFPLTGSGKALPRRTGDAAEVDLFGIKTKVDMT